ncbi:RWD domain-containing protein 2B [Aricia agestis]|uniref:RWD domain-containing protein 2B n=1 Tax=Aricia agestis TaxID=91739 RepID=UPI001C201C46|nr:RWD domain-containing protein 2B [Aricia agestis]
MASSETNLEETLAECLSQQLCEIELLKSMYPNNDDIVFTDRKIIDVITNFLNSESKKEFVPDHIDFILKLSVNENKLEMCVNLPSFYPNEDPEIYLRCNQLNRQQETSLNENLSKFIKAEKQEGEVCIYTAISWVQEHLDEFISITLHEPRDQHQHEQEDIKFCRYWIYSHHIYNKRKREVIVNVAKDYKLTGFCLPGKPGIIYIEGDENDCHEWWKVIKSMNWKKIVLRKNNIFEQSERKKQQKFTSFQEISFASCKQSKHSNMGEFCKYMEKFGLGADINEFFGLCTKEKICD